ncbi:ATP-binding protein [Anoxynatronum sibiricum]|uniref:histidine kinase n=1 Tax=Anoxynatronum sibiricum TaxID=210623 RepID=A0ABU9VTC6_9CLOT
MLKYHLRPKRILYFVFVLFVLGILFVNRSHQLQTGKSLFQRTRLEILTDEETHWLKAKGALKAAVLTDNAPLSGFSSEGYWRGVDVLYLGYLERELGVPIELVPLERGEQVAALQQGEVDLIIAPPLMKYKEILRYTLPLYEIRSIAVTASSGLISQVNDFAGLRVAFLEEDYTQEFLSLKRLVYQGSVVTHIGKGLEAVKEGRTDAFIGPEPLILKALKEVDGLPENGQTATNLPDLQIAALPAANFHLTDFPVFKKEYSLAVPTEHAILFSLVNKAVYNLEQTGTMTHIQQRIFGISDPLVGEPLTERYLSILVIFGLALSLIFYLFYSSNFSLRMAIEDKMKELDDSRQELQNAFDGIEHVIMVVDGNYRIRLLNQYALRWFQQSESQLTGKTLEEIMDEPFYTKIIPVVADSFLDRVSHDRVFQHGKWIYELGTAPLEYRNDSVSKMLLTLKDVTEEYQQEQVLLQKNKMAAIGQLAAGVAHEIRNPLGVIRNYAFLLKQRLQGADTALQYAETIDQIAQRANAILNNLLDISRTESGQWKTVSVRRSIARIVELQQSTLKDKTIDIRIAGDDTLEMSLPLDVMDTTLVNLISNARDAIDDQGKIEIHFEKAKDFLHLQVTDTGIGMNPDVKLNVFDPFFTTKPPGEGVGLGLNIVYNMIHQIGGEIHVESHPGQGTTFSILIPTKREGSH